MGHVYRIGPDSGYGFAVVVGAGGYDSDWDCKLVVCVSDGLVYLGHGLVEELEVRLQRAQRAAPYQSNPQRAGGTAMFTAGYKVEIQTPRSLPG